MSDPTSRLPARPSLEHLRKQAKDRLAALRAADPTTKLADAQYALAREYGFECWPKLVHHVESLPTTGRLREFERLADDILAGYGGDLEALERLIAHFGLSYSPDRTHREIQERLRASRGDRPGEPSLQDAQGLVAHQYGHDSWAGLESALAEPGSSGKNRSGAAPPFYRIDTDHNTIEPKEPLSRGDWETIFGVMREQRITGIKTRGAMTDAAMAGLSQLEFVTSIRVEGGQGFTDDGLLRLAGMPQLETLDLSGRHSRVTDRGLDVLGDLPRLRRFAMCWGQQVTDAGAANLRHCDNLERVDLMGTRTGNGVLEALRGKRQLSELHTGMQVTDDGLLHLHELPMFTTWREADFKSDLMADRAPTHHLLLDGPFTDRGLATLRGLEGLHGLSLFWHAHAFTGGGLAALAHLPNLCVLGCQGERCDDAGMRSLGNLSGLRGLVAQGTVASDDGFVALSRSQSIEYIWGRECPNLHGRGFVALADMPSLHGLGVSCKRVDDASLAVLSRFAELRQLMPMDVDDAGFRHVGACEGLEDLFCMYCPEMGDGATEHIAHLRLRSYYAGGTKMTDRSLALLARMTSLEKVELRANAGITDSGVAMLSALPHLQEIAIGDSPRVSARGMAAFGAHVRVDYAP